MADGVPDEWRKNRELSISFSRYAAHLGLCNTSVQLAAIASVVMPSSYTNGLVRVTHLSALCSGDGGGGGARPGQLWRYEIVDAASIRPTARLASKKSRPRRDPEPHLALRVRAMQ